MTHPTDHKRRVIWFCGTEKVAAHPEHLARLRDSVGLTTIMPESPVCHTSGFRASDEMAARGPFEDWRSREDLHPRAADGIYPPVAGIVGGFDDTDLRRVIDAAHDAGIEVWGHIGLWSYGGEIFPEYAMRDVDGNELGSRWHRWGTGLCPSHPQVDGWTADGLVEAARDYDVDGFCVDHARYPHPANLHSLTACACEHCCATGRELGFHSDTLVDIAREARNALQRLDGPRVRRALTSDLRGSDLLIALGVPPQTQEWLRMRAAILAHRIESFRQRVRGVKSDLVFGSDVFAPSISLWGGQDLGRWESATDFITGGSSAGGVVGWATGATSAAGEWARALRDVDGDVADTDASTLALRILQHDDSDVPRDPDALMGELPEQPLPITELYEREIARLVAVTSDHVPLYPPISVGGDHDRTRRLATSVHEHGCHGAMITIDAENDAAQQALCDGLGTLAG